MPKFKVGQEVVCLLNGRHGFVRLIFEDKFAPYYNVVWYADEIEKEWPEKMPLRLFWEFELSDIKKKKPDQLKLIE